MIEKVKDWAEYHSEKVVAFIQGWNTGVWSAAVYIIALALLLKAGVVGWPLGLLLSIVTGIAGGTINLIQTGAIFE